MKKFIVLFVLLISSVSFANSGKEVLKSNLVLEENLVGSSCTATVTYKGVYVTHFTVYSNTSDTTTACILARAAAWSFIQQQMLAEYYSLPEATQPLDGGHLDEEVPATP